MPRRSPRAGTASRVLLTSLPCLLSGAAASVAIGAHGGPTATVEHYDRIISYNRLFVGMKDVSEPANACVEVSEHRALLGTGRATVMPRRDAYPPNSAVVKVQLPGKARGFNRHLRVRLKLTASADGKVTRYDYVVLAGHPYVSQPPNLPVSRRGCG